jgi:quinol-cytochrome oxidoreductase complex cytochrome b subunit
MGENQHSRTTMGGRITESRLWRSIVRHGLPSTDLGSMRTMVTNFFLHIFPAKVHPHSLRSSYTWGLGVIATILFIILTITGALLMFFYIPSVSRAYRDMKDLQFAVSYGILLRNMHRWAAHGMVLVVLLHMSRVFYTASYRRPREFNWVLGVALWLITLFLSFTGYLLPWDQLAFWAITVGTSIASYPPWVGKAIRTLLLGGDTVSQGALIRFYALHVFVLPLSIIVMVAVHFWRVRKDGGLSRPILGAEEAQEIASSEAAVPEGIKTYALMEVTGTSSPMVATQDPDETVSSWPHLTFRLLLLFQGVLIVFMIFSLFFNAPLEELANPIHPPNPAKAPWYFLGLQELVGYSALVGGVVVPAVAVLGLMSIPYIDTTEGGSCSCHWGRVDCQDETMPGVWFTSAVGMRVATISFMGAIPIVPLLVYLNAKVGLRVFYPSASQWMMDLINPATVLLILMAISSAFVTYKSGSRRLGAICLYSSFLSAYIVLIIIGTYFRGPNWGWV